MDDDRQGRIFFGAILIILGIGLIALQYVEGFSDAVILFLIGGLFVAGYFNPGLHPAGHRFGQGRGKHPSSFWRFRTTRSWGGLCRHLRHRSGVLRQLKLVAADPGADPHRGRALRGKRRLWASGLGWMADHFRVLRPSAPSRRVWVNGSKKGEGSSRGRGTK